MTIENLYSVTISDGGESGVSKYIVRATDERSAVLKVLNSKPGLTYFHKIAVGDFEAILVD